MRTDLKKSFVLLAIATVAVLGVGAITFRDLARDIAPTASHGIVPLGKRDWPSAFTTLDRVELGTKSGYVVTYDRSTNNKNGEVRFEGVRVTTLECTSLTEPVADDLRDRCALNEVRITLLRGQTPSDVRLYRYDTRGSGSDKTWRPAGRYVVKVHETGLSSSDPSVAAFEQFDTPVRRFLPMRVVSTRHVPSLVVLVAFGAFAFALSRARRATAYADGMSQWVEAKLSADGMLQDEAGGTIGVLASGALGRGRVPEGIVLVDPAATQHGSVYRELPVVARHSVAAGSHALWAAATALRLRDAKSLATIGAVTALLGLAARFLGA